jgi:hypothetical protein
MRFVKVSTRILLKAQDPFGKLSAQKDIKKEVRSYGTEEGHQ